MLFSSFKLTEDSPIYSQIEEYIKKGINHGVLKKGNKLPSTRELSNLLKISRNSVLTAYENLEAQGVIKSLTGKGTFIDKEIEYKDEKLTINWDEMLSYYATQCRQLDIIKTELPWEKGMISFKSIAPHESLFDLEEFKRAFLECISLEGNKVLNYGYAKGYKPLMEYLMTYMEQKGVSTKNKDILIVNGFTEGMDIILSALTKPGDIIVCEDPTHNTALKMMHAHQLDIAGVPMNRDGIDIDELEKTLKLRTPKLGYIIPSYHNPTGIVLKGEKRQKVLEIYKKYQIPVIEDGFNEELLYSSSPMLPIAALAPNSNGVIYIGSFSKILFPGLRIGWILADKKLIDVLESVKRTRNIHTSFLDQAILYHYMISGSFERYIKKARKHYKEKYLFTMQQINEFIPHEYIMGEGGLHIFVKLKGVCARNVLKRCAEKGVLFTPGDIFYVDKKEKSTLRLGFSRLSDEEIRRGIKVIGEVVKELGSS